MTLFPPPCDLGAPERFTTWRREQVEAVNLLSESDKRFIGLCLPTGTGKSLAGVMGGVMQGKRTVILTSTKALQDQYLGDFHPIGMVDVRGMNNYPCRPDVLASLHYPRDTAVDRAPCRGGYRCEYAAGASGCGYYDAVAAGWRSMLTVANYSFWLRMDIKKPSLGKPELLILDEAHAAPDEVAEAMRVRLYHDEAKKYLGYAMPDAKAPMREWVPWLRQSSITMQCHVDQALQWIRQADGWSVKEADEIRRMRDYSSRLTRAALADTSNWVVLPGEGKTSAAVDVAPIWPRELTEDYLFRGIESIALLSATMRPKTAELLGIAEKDLEWKEWDTGFPPQRRPVIVLKTARMRYTMERHEFRTWARTIAQIVRSRADYKGIIHTVSYRRAEELIELIGEDLAEAGVEVFLHDSKSTARAIHDFKQFVGGAILVSPVVSTGYDFPYEQCTYQIVGKVPWPDTRDPVTKARLKQDSTYGAYVALHEIVQMAGRGMRAPDDYCETWIVDDFFSILKNSPKTRGLLPRAFTRALTRRGFVEAIKTNPWIKRAQDARRAEKGGGLSP